MEKSNSKKIPYRTHNALVHHINKCNFMVSILEKRFVKFVWNLLNSENVLFGRICRYSVYDSDTTMGENMRYFMYKYNLLYDDWFSDLNNIYIKIEGHVHNITKHDDVCVCCCNQGIV